MRQRYLTLHRVVGRTYVAGVFISAPLGVYIQYLNEPLGFSRSFTIETVFQASLWMLTTGIAFWFILQGKVQQHRQWMTRSFGTGPLIFLEVRVIFNVFHITDPHWIEIVVWSCTASSLFVADVVLQVQEMLRMRPRTSKAARVAPALEAV